MFPVDGLEERSLVDQCRRTLRREDGLHYAGWVYEIPMPFGLRTEHAMF